MSSEEPISINPVYSKEKETQKMLFNKIDKPNHNICENIR
jgi:hypothetical protein